MNVTVFWDVILCSVVDTPLLQRNQLPFVFRIEEVDGHQFFRGNLLL
jgi:hypothetical protein